MDEDDLDSGRGGARRRTSHLLVAWFSLSDASREGARAGGIHR
jgi:hypothetical protein